VSNVDAGVAHSLEPVVRGLQGGDEHAVFTPSQAVPEELEDYLFLLLEHPAAVNAFCR
jgi:hypothetical protein